jgi:hypothetical protein
MSLYRYRAPSVTEQKKFYYEAFQKPTHRRRFLIGIFFLVLIAGTTWFLKAQNKNYTGPGEFAAASIIFPLPSDINSNFSNQVHQCFIPTAGVYGYTLRISSGFRSLDEQDDLYNQGRTINGHIVTEAMAGKSIHNYGFAVDVVDRFRGFDIDWEKLGRIGAYCGLEQGDDGDLPHFEHRAGLTTDQFRQGLRPPHLTLPCEIMSTRFASNEPLTLSDLKNCHAPQF